MKLPLPDAGAAKTAKPIATLVLYCPALLRARGARGIWPGAYTKNLSPGKTRLRVALLAQIQIRINEACANISGPAPISFLFDMGTLAGLTGEKPRHARVSQPDTSLKIA
jgi:hypothetical protein